MNKNILPHCANCQIPVKEKICVSPRGKGIKGCPTLSKKKHAELSKKEYKKGKNAEFARQASIQEGECYVGRDKKPYLMHPVKPRIQEICEFAQKMGYRRLGLIFCMGFQREVPIIARIFENYGFELVSVVCKAGAIPKEEIGIKDSEKIFIGEYESMCNPILQAMLVNEAKTDFNIVLGLCVGHDSLFFRYAEAPTTVLAVKDRVTGHNPLACIYTSGNFYSWLNTLKSQDAVDKV